MLQLIDLVIGPIRMTNQKNLPPFATFLTAFTQSWAKLFDWSKKSGSYKKCKWATCAEVLLVVMNIFALEFQNCSVTLDLCMLLFILMLEKTLKPPLKSEEPLGHDNKHTDVIEEWKWLFCHLLFLMECQNYWVITDNKAGRELLGQKHILWWILF